MRHHQRAAYCTFVAALLLVGLSEAQAESALPEPSNFDNRFHFQPYSPTPRIPESEQLLKRLKQLLISPADAQSGALAVGPSSPSQEREPPRTAKNSSLHKQASEKQIAIGRAAFYEHSGRTASGEKYNPDGLTAAHKSLALGTRLRVVNLRNRRSIIVQVTDRSPRQMKFVIDLSRGSAKAIGITKRAGTALVAIYRLNGSDVNNE